LKPRLLQVTGIGQGKRIKVRDRGFHIRLSPAEGEFLVHPSPVAIQERDPVSRFQKLRDFELACTRFLQDALRFRQTAKRKIEVGNQGIPERKFGIEFDRQPGFFSGLSALR
jgi:hypothetical protein